MSDKRNQDDDGLGGLAEAARALVQAATRAGANDADAVVRRSRSFGVSVRNGAVEDTENSESDRLSLRVFVGHRIATVSAVASDDFTRLAERAVAMAKVSPEDPAQMLAPEGRYATAFPDLDLFDATAPDSARLTDMALAAESAALAVRGVTASSGASAGRGETGLVLVTSRGFEGTFRRSSFSVSASAIAGTGTAMERDFKGSGRIHFADLDDPSAVGREAGERAAARLGATRPATGRMAVVFDPRVARGLVGHLAGAVDGGAIVRGASFLKARMGERILPEGVSLVDDPLIARRPASRPFDGEGISGEKLTLVEDGVLKTWLLSLSVARELGLETNGRGARGGSGVMPAPTNFGLLPGTRAREELIAEIGSGLYITEVFGQGVNIVTGQYSRGASGFKIENGEITTPVSEFTIAGELPEIYASLMLADDIDTNYSVLAPTLAVPAMMVAGR